MKVLLVGNGGREHALAWKIAASDRCDRLFAAPGNPGIAQHAECVGIPADDVPGLAKFAIDQKIDLTVIGPEDALAGGLADRLDDAGLKVFGPTKAAAELEADKVFAKQLMRQHAIPTAEARSFDDAEQATEYVLSRTEPMVVTDTSASRRPSRIPPTIAPGRLPSPPMTAPMSPLALAAVWPCSKNQSTMKALMTNTTPTSVCHKRTGACSWSWPQPHSGPCSCS